jgi:hypothetical protein
MGFLLVDRRGCGVLRLILFQHILLLLLLDVVVPDVLIPMLHSLLSVDDVLQCILVRISLRSLDQHLPPVSVNHVLVYKPVCTLSP